VGTPRGFLLGRGRLLQEIRKKAVDAKPGRGLSQLRPKRHSHLLSENGPDVLGLLECILVAIGFLKDFGNMVDGLKAVKLAARYVRAGISRLPTMWHQHLIAWKGIRVRFSDDLRVARWVASCLILFGVLLVALHHAPIAVEDTCLPDC
jgi:hypothetical protein